MGFPPDQTASYDDVFRQLLDVGWPPLAIAGFAHLAADRAYSLRECYGHGSEQPRRGA